MPRVFPLSPSFNAGELSPRLAARTDFSKFPSGLETCLNLIPLSEGGAMRRAGSRYIAGLKSSSVKGRLKRFQFSTAQAYILELGDSVMRFYRHQGQITVANTDASISNGTFTSNITGWDDRSTGGAGNQISHDSTNGRLTLETSGTAADDIGWAEQDVTTTATGTEHVIRFRVIGAPGDKIEFQVGSSSSGSEILSALKLSVGYHSIAFTPDASPFYVQFRNRGSDQDKDVQIDDVSLIDDSALELTTPWPEADLYTVEGPQSADVLYLFHASYPTYKLERRGHTTWSLVEVAWQDGPWLAENTTTTTLTASAATGLGITVTASSTAGINGGDGFKTTDIGRLVRITDGTVNWGWGVIVGRTSSTVVTVDVKRTFVVTTAETKWRLGAWSGTTGYPQVGTFYEQRLMSAATTDQPQTFWGSQTGDFENMAPDSPNSDGTTWAGTVEDDDAFDYTISADDVNAIRWLSAGEDTLSIGTTGGEWVPSSEGAVLTPSDITVRRQTTHGSAQVQPVRVDNVVLFAQRAKRKIREFGFSFEVDGYQAFDMTRLAAHLTKGGIVEMAFAEEPDSLVYAVRSDGVLLSMTYRREEDVVGWARHVFGGWFHAAITKVWQVDGDSFTEETTDANSASNADWILFPATEAVGDYAAFGYTEPFTQMIFDYANGTAGVGGAVTWEYWDGSSWTALSGVTDGTTGFTAAAADTLKVTWTKPGNWKKRVLSSGKSLYYVRARITTVYTTNPILDQGFVSAAPVVESVAVIPGANGAGQTQDSSERDEVWVTVKRTINGSTARYIEVLERDFEDGDDQEDAYYADSLLTYDSTSTTSITGLSHLEGEIVKIWADGAIQADKTVSSGAITLDTAASVVQVGLGYTHRLKTLKPEGGNPAGTAVGKTKRISGIDFVVHNTHTFSFGPDVDNLEMKDFRVVSDPMDASAPLYTGEAYREFEGNWETDTRIVVESDEPAPFMLLALAPRMSVNPAS